KWILSRQADLLIGGIRQICGRIKTLNWDAGGRAIQAARFWLPCDEIAQLVLFPLPLRGNDLLQHFAIKHCWIASLLGRWNCTRTGSSRIGRVKALAERHPRSVSTKDYRNGRLNCPIVE